MAAGVLTNAIRFGGTSLPRRARTRAHVPGQALSEALLEHVFEIPSYASVADDAAGAPPDEEHQVP